MRWETKEFLFLNTLVVDVRGLLKLMLDGWDFASLGEFFELFRNCFRNAGMWCCYWCCLLRLLQRKPESLSTIARKICLHINVLVGCSGVCVLSSILRWHNMAWPNHVCVCVCVFVEYFLISCARLMMATRMLCDFHSGMYECVSAFYSHFVSLFLNRSTFLLLVGLALSCDWCHLVHPSKPFSRITSTDIKAQTHKHKALARRKAAVFSLPSRKKRAHCGFTASASW